MIFVLRPCALPALGTERGMELAMDGKGRNGREVGKRGDGAAVFDEEERCLMWAGIAGRD